MLLYRAGKSYKKTGNVTKTEETYTRLINSHPSLYIGYAQLAWVYADEGIKLEKGLELAEKAKQLQPGNPIILDTIGWLHYKLERHEKALKILNKAVNIDNRIPSLLYHLGVVQYKAGMPDQSVESLKRSLEISERFDEADKARDFLDRHFQEVQEEGE
jgi:tetratricopeptide (TPR) repeat protein